MGLSRQNSERYVRGRRRIPVPARLHAIGCVRHLLPRGRRYRHAGLNTLHYSGARAKTASRQLIALRNSNIQEKSENSAWIELHSFNSLCVNANIVHVEETDVGEFVGHYALNLAVCLFALLRIDLFAPEFNEFVHPAIGVVSAVRAVRWHRSGVEHVIKD